MTIAEGTSTVMESIWRQSINDQIQEEDLTTNKLDMQGEKIDVLTSTPMGHNTPETMGQEDGRHINHMSHRHIKSMLTQHERGSWSPVP